MARHRCRGVDSRPRRLRVNATADPRSVVIERTDFHVVHSGSDLANDRSIRSVSAKNS
jgi:hypothetical protein